MKQIQISCSICSLFFSMQQKLCLQTPESRGFCCKDHYYEVQRLLRRWFYYSTRCPRVSKSRGIPTRREVPAGERTKKQTAPYQEVAGDGDAYLLFQPLLESPLVCSPAAFPLGLPCHLVCLGSPGFRGLVHLLRQLPRSLADHLRTRAEFRIRSPACSSLFASMALTEVPRESWQFLMSFEMQTCLWSLQPKKGQYPGHMLVMKGSFLNKTARGSM